MPFEHAIKCPAGFGETLTQAKESVAYQNAQEGGKWVIYPPLFPLFLNPVNVPRDAEVEEVEVK